MNTNEKAEIGKTEIPIVRPKRPKRMGVVRLGRIHHQLFKLERELKAALAADYGLQGIHGQVDKLGREVYQLLEERRLAEARRKDKGEILWTIYRPRQGWMDRVGSTIRTPHLTIRKSSWGLSKDEPSYYVHDCPSINRPWEDLAQEWERARQDFPLAGMGERARIVDSKPRGFFASEFGELEREEQARLEKLADPWCRVCGGRGYGYRRDELFACGCTATRKEAA